jgi:Cytochrome P460
MDRDDLARPLGRPGHLRAGQVRREGAGWARNVRVPRIWQAISISRNERVVALILGNPAMIDAYQASIPSNGKPVPDGAKMAKIHWIPKQNQFFPDATVPGNLLNVDFMVKDSKRFADSGGWGYGVFDYDAASGTFKPGTTAGTPPQGNDAKCGYACHTRAKARDYVFTEYGKR